MTLHPRLYPDHLYLNDPICDHVATIIRHHKQTGQLSTLNHPQFSWLQRVITFFARTSNENHTLDMLNRLTREEIRLLIYLQTFSGVVATSDECGQSLDQIAQATQVQLLKLSHSHTQLVNERISYILELSQRFFENKRRRDRAKAWNTVKPKDYTLVRQFLRSYVLKHKLAHAQVTCDPDVGIIFVSDPKFHPVDAETDAFIDHLLREDPSFVGMRLAHLFPMSFGVYHLRTLISGPSSYGFITTKSLSFDGAASAVQILRTKPTIFGVARMDRGLWVQRWCRPKLVLSARRDVCDECWSTEHSFETCPETDHPRWPPCRIMDASSMNFTHIKPTDVPAIPVHGFAPENSQQKAPVLSLALVRRSLDREGIEHTAQLGQFTSRLSFYDLEAPIETDLAKIDVCVRARLSLLDQIESLHSKTPDATLKSAILTAFPLDPLNSSADRHILYNQRLRDFASHHILAQVYARDPSQHAKYVRREQKLFEIRYSMLMPRERSDFVTLHQQTLNWIPVEYADHADIAKYVTSASHVLLRAAVGDLNPNLYITIDSLAKFVRYYDVIYKTDMFGFPELFGTRNFYINRGYMYFPASMQLHVLSSVFAQRLRRRLEDYRAKYLAEEPAHTTQIISNYVSLIHQPAPPPSEPPSECLANSVYSLISHFPPCVTSLLQHLSHTGHLKFKGRQQLVFFLKGIGVRRDEAIKFMRQNLTRSSVITFKTKYETPIAHLYDSDIGYVPISCTKIIAYPAPKMSQPHGCPFKHSSPVQLRKLVHDSCTSAQETEIEDIVSSAISGKHINACQTLFRTVHGEELRHTNPHTYFFRSRDAQKARIEIEVEGHVENTDAED